ncbi:Maf family nucleotide pyrophosphatase [Phaeodactylibacter luteus]|uniref:dTTP/UTP pyrophosphatase n=1 Tax=Phaeodactylibacter luteus TaxID=1564516 RepID=A0A5C6RJ74_9BACT|nr:Maf family nucleotide pyrophosphatase [Phaeodactylibacter luteus]TXB61985.1 septum formation protein Maf [Phaeodactylibacter luteus]
MDILNQKLVLASKSPRRSQLLRQAGFSFDIRPLDVPEDYPPEIDPLEVAPFLAKKKADGGKHLLQEGEILLTADSVVILNGKIYEKPQGQEDAHRILRQLSGNVHTVVTGVCLSDGQREKVFAGHSKVHFGELSEEEIAYYVEACKPYDKAGAYAIQEWIGLCKIHKIEGTYANIMGLPVDLVYAELAGFLKA